MKSDYLTPSIESFLCSLFVYQTAPSETRTFMTTKLERVVYARITTEDYRALNVLADERQQTISQLIRKVLIDSGVLSR